MERATLVTRSVVAQNGTAVLPGGTIRFAGRAPPSTFGAVLKVPVTGGTGRFAGARGRLEVRQLSRTRAANVYRLTLP